MKVDGQDIPVEQATFAVDGKTMAFAIVSKQNPASLAMNRASVEPIDSADR